jgi:uncharacterized protein (TIGR00369 family)
MTFVQPTLIPNHRADLKALIESMPISAHLGVVIVGFGDGSSMIEMPVRRQLTFDGRTVMGGIVGTLGDIAAVSAATAAMQAGWLSSTTSFQVYNLEPAAGDTLVAIGKAIKVSKSGGVAAADVFAVRDGENRHVACVLATCRFFQVPTT